MPHIKIDTVRHIDTGAAFTVVGCTASADVRRNPYYPGEYGEEEKYDVQNFKVVSRSGRDITGQIEEWEATGMYWALVEAFEEEQNEILEEQIEAQMETIRGLRA